MELFKSLETKKKILTILSHFEINEPLTEEAIKEISNAEIADPRNANLKYDGTRALDGEMVLLDLELKTEKSKNLDVMSLKKTQINFQI